MVDTTIKKRSKATVKIASVLISFLTITGCATDSGGVVPIGPDMYMIGRLGQFTDFSSSAVKARLYKSALEFCLKDGRVMSPLNSTGQDSGPGTYASAEIKARCSKG